MIDLSEYGFDDRETAYIQSYLEYCQKWKPGNYYLQDPRISIDARLTRLLSHLNDSRTGKFFRGILFNTEDSLDSYNASNKIEDDPLWHFDVLGNWLFSVVEPTHDPLYVTSRIKEGLDGAEHLKPLLKTLVELLNLQEEAINGDQRFLSCIGYINALYEEFEPTYIRYLKKEHIIWVCPDFSVTKTYLESLADDALRIEHLRKLKIDCEAYNAEAELDATLSKLSEHNKDAREAFIKLCDINIRRLEALQELKRPDEVSQPTIDQATTKNGDRTLDRTTLFLNYLLTNAKADCTNIDKAKTISFLTGYSEKTIRQKLSNIHGKDNDKSFETYNEDMRKVRDYFNLVGLTEIAERVERDMDN